MKTRLDDAVLVCILLGYDTVDDIAEALRVDRGVVERVVNRLRALDLVRFEEKGFWIFKRRVLRLTDAGFERAMEVRRELERVAERVRADLERGVAPEELVAMYGYTLPLLALMGFIDLAMLAPILGLLFIPDTGDVDTELM